MQDVVLDALDRDLDDAAPTAVRLEVDGRSYFRMLLADAVEALFRPLARDEVDDRVARGVIDAAPSRVYFVFGLERPRAEENP
jgi:hypothetical protein